MIYFPHADLIRGEILTEETNVKANITLSSSQILSIGGEKSQELLSIYVCTEILQESALHLKHYPGAVSWLQTAAAQLATGKEVSNCCNPETILQLFFVCFSFSKSEPRKP